MQSKEYAAQQPAVGVGLLRLLFPIIFVCVALAAPARAADDKRADYYLRIVEAAFARTTKDFGPYEFKRPPSMSHSRIIAEMENGGSREWAVFPASPDLHRRLLPVEVPIAKGILGYRAFLIHKDSQEAFRKIESLDQLKALRLGAGQDWIITGVFRANRFNVVTGASYDGLFEMLANGRFDYFPRGVNEILDEFEQRKEVLPDLRVEDSILLYTPLPVIIYVSPMKPLLAERLRVGLERMKKDGSFDAMFHEAHGRLIDALNLKGRRVFRIPNPALKGMSFLDHKELWYAID